MATNVYRTDQNIYFRTCCTYQGYYISTSGDSTEVYKDSDTWEVFETIAEEHFPTASPIRMAGILLLIENGDDGWREWAIENLEKEIDGELTDIQRDYLKHTMGAVIPPKTQATVQ